VIDAIVGQREPVEITVDKRQSVVVGIPACVLYHLRTAVETDAAADVPCLSQRPKRVPRAGSEIEYRLAGLDRHPRQRVLCGVPVPFLHAFVPAVGRPLVEFRLYGHRVVERSRS
jgi:hypothetical protein